MTGVIMQNVLESKSLLAKLMATENISVQYTPGIKTAMFDLNGRILMLPVSNDISVTIQPDT